MSDLRMRTARQKPPASKHRQIGMGQREGSTHQLEQAGNWDGRVTTAQAIRAFTARRKRSTHVAAEFRGYRGFPRRIRHRVPQAHGTDNRVPHSLDEARIVSGIANHLATRFTHLFKASSYEITGPSGQIPARQLLPRDYLVGPLQHRQQDTKNGWARVSAARLSGITHPLKGSSSKGPKRRTGCWGAGIKQPPRNAGGISRSPAETQVLRKGTNRRVSLQMKYL